MAKPAKAPKDNSDVNVTVTSVPDSSSTYNNIVGVMGEDPGQTVGENGGTFTFQVAGAEAASEYLFLVNDPFRLTANTDIRYYVDTNHDERLDSGDQLIYQGETTGFTIADLQAAAKLYGTTDFIAAFDDSNVVGGVPTPDLDYNDIIVAISLEEPKAEKTVHPNSGRGNGPEVVNGVDVDPGNSGGPNNGGDYADMWV
jgi:hypothetical protein